MHRVTRFSLLGLYLAASLWGGALPHAEDCAAHAHDAEHHAPGDAPGWLAAEADHESECATCKFLGQRSLSPTADPLPGIEHAVAVRVVSRPFSDIQWPRSPHDPRGPPLA